MHMQHRQQIHRQYQPTVISGASPTQVRIHLNPNQRALRPQPHSSDAPDLPGKADGACISVHESDCLSLQNFFSDMSDPWTLSLLDESSSTPAWSRLDPPRFSSILAGACHFSRKEKKKKKKKKKKTVTPRALALGSRASPSLQTPHLPSTVLSLLTCTMYVFI